MVHTYLASYAGEQYIRFQIRNPITANGGGVSWLFKYEEEFDSLQRVSRDTGPASLERWRPEGVGLTFLG